MINGYQDPQVRKAPWHNGEVRQICLVLKKRVAWERATGHIGSSMLICKAGSGGQKHLLPSEGGEALGESKLS